MLGSTRSPWFTESQFHILGLALHVVSVQEKTLRLLSHTDTALFVSQSALKAAATHTLKASSHL